MWCVAAASLGLGIWIYLIFLHGNFWLADEREDDKETDAGKGGWPSVAVVIPACDEAAMLPVGLPSILTQDYPGKLSVILVDDQSSDGTAAAARAVASKTGRELRIVEGKSLPAGWTGKVWAQAQGIAQANAARPAPDYLLLTDADIHFAPGTLKRLVARGKSGDYVVISLMAKLHCQSFAERALIPAFVYFFQTLYPFAWVNRRDRKVAAAAGGCMLVEQVALTRAGGIEAIQGALIDDCALAKLMKQQGPISLQLSEDVSSIRPYPSFGDIGRMISRSAYAQLNYSLLLLGCTVAGMFLTFFVPPFLTVFGGFPANWIAGLAWALMTLSFLPILHFYRQSPFWTLALPMIAACYVAFTVNSAYQHWRGFGGMWKGRSQALAKNR
jgi:hopene-associated glycosyltransferase HpnB